MYTWGARKGRVIIMPFCSSCGTDVSGVKFCSKCGQPVEDAPAATPGPAEEAPASPEAGSAPPQAAPAPTAPAANDNVLGAVAYLTIVPAIVFLLIEPYNKNRFVRFHSLQCLLLAGAIIVLNTANIVIGFVPVLGFVTFLTTPLVFLAMVAAWLIAVIKAFNGEEFRLPIIGDMAARNV